MADYKKIAEKFKAQRVTFASPRPPEPAPVEEFWEFSRRYLPRRFVTIVAVIVAICCAGKSFDGDLSIVILPSE
jgi:hypothetical protein